MNDEAYADPPRRTERFFRAEPSSDISEPHLKTQDSGRVLHDRQLRALPMSRTVHLMWCAHNSAILNASYDIRVDPFIAP